MNVDYELAWKDMKKWLDNGVAFMEERKEVVNGREYQRIKSKLEGLRIARQYMQDSEKIYQVAEEEELELEFSKLSTEAKMNFFKTLDEKKLAKNMLNAIMKERM
jgi:hypothetical protein